MITERIILWDTKYGVIKSCLKDILDTRGISLYQLSRLSDLRYEVVYRYYHNEVQRYDSEVLAKLCYVLNCHISDLIKYESSN